MKRWLVLLTTSLALPGTVFAQTDAEILQQLEALQKQVKQQQKVIEQLKRRLTTEETVSKQGVVSRLVREEVDAAMERQEHATDRAADTGVTIPSFIENLTLKSDLRLRYELRQLDGDDPGSDDERQKSRFRHRVRFGGVWENPAENWEIGAGLEIGSESGTSANASWNKDSAFESTDVYLDYAYARHRLGTATLTLGQQKNPFESGPYVWDSDLRPTGATLQFADNLPVFATIGAYNVRGDTSVTGSNDQSTANMYAAQLGTTLRTEKTRALFALGYYHYDTETSEYVFGQGNDDYQYQLGDLYASLGTDVGQLSLEAFGQYSINFGSDDMATQLGTVPPGYDSEDQNTAWALGFGGSIGRFGLEYNYAHIEGDAIPFFFADSDFGDGLPDDAVNAEGHVIKASFKITTHLKLGIEADLTEPIEDSAGTADIDVALYQFDLKYKF